MGKSAIKLKVASPCDADWDSMSGDEAIRHCSLCDQKVYQLSMMTSDELEALLESRKGMRTCGRFYQRADGTVLTADCVVGKDKKRKKKLLKVMGGAAVVLSAFGIRQLNPAGSTLDTNISDALNFEAMGEKEKTTPKPGEVEPEPVEPPTEPVEPPTEPVPVETLGEIMIMGDIAVDPVDPKSIPMEPRLGQVTVIGDTENDPFQAVEQE